MQIISPESHAHPLIHQRISRKPVNLDSIEAMTPEKDKMIVGTFLNIEYPGQSAAICCKYYKGQQYFKQVMQDGVQYKIPLSVCRHINERCFHEPHSYLTDEKGSPIKSSKKVFRYKFIVESN